MNVSAQYVHWANVLTRDSFQYGFFEQINVPVEYSVLPINTRLGSSTAYPGHVPVLRRGSHAMMQPICCLVPISSFTLTSTWSVYQSLGPWPHFLAEYLEYRASCVQG